MATNTYYSPFFPAVENPGAKGTTIAAVPSTTVTAIQSNLGTVQDAIDKLRGQGYLDLVAPPIITGLALSSTGVFAASGEQVITLVATWNKSPATDLATYEIQIKEGSGSYILYSTGKDTSAVATQSYQWFVRPNQTYTVRVRGVDLAGNVGGWSAEVSILSTKDTVPPAAVVGISATTSYETAFIKWTNPADLDLAGAKVELYKGSTLVNVVSVGAAASSVSSVTFTGLTKASTYMVRVYSFDNSGNFGTFTQSPDFTTSGGIAAGDFAPDVTPIQTVTALPNPTNYVGAKVVLFNGKLYRYANGAWTAAVDGADIAPSTITSVALVDSSVTTNKIADAVLTASKFSPGVTPVEIMAALPTTGNVAGRMVFLTTDGKLYKFVNGGWTKAVDGGDIVPSSVAGTALVDASVTNAKIAVNSITADKIVANSITGNKLILASRPFSTIGMNIRVDSDNVLRWDGGYLQYQDDNGNYTSWAIAGGGVAYPNAPLYVVWNTKTKPNRLDYTTDYTVAFNGDFKNVATWNSGADLVVNAGVGTSINGGNIVTGTITATKIVARSLTADRIAAGAITANEIAVGTITAGQIAAGTITSGQIASGTITAGNILSGTITATQLATNSITSDKILANSITANKLAIGSRPISTVGFNFRVDAGGSTLRWDLGYLQFASDAGSYASYQIGASSSGYVGTSMYFVWNTISKPTTIDWSTDPAILVNKDYIQIGTWNGGSDWTAKAGVGTILNGDRIVTGTINANKLIANSITATQIAGGTITGDKLVAGTINAAQIGAGAITATKLSIGNSDSIIPDNGFEDPNFWFPGNPAVSFGVTNAAWPASTNLLAIYPADNTLRDSYTPFFDVEPGGSYRIRAWFFADQNFSGTMNMALHMPGSQWFGLKAGNASNPDATDANTVTAPTGGVIFKEWVVDNPNTFDCRNWQFRFKFAFTGGFQFYTTIMRVSGVTLIRDGAITTEKITVGTLNGDRISVGTLDANTLKANSVLAGNIVVSGTGQTLQQVAATAASGGGDPAAKINAGTTLIDPGKITISGGTTLANWRGGGDNTQINGGAIAANTIKTNSLVVGARALTMDSISFEIQYLNGGLELAWTAGAIYWTNSAGGPQGVLIPAGNTYGVEKICFIYWVEGGGSLYVTHSLDILARQDCVLLATYQGSTMFNATYGATIINGDRITTGSINANKITAGTITAGQIAAGGITADKLTIGSASGARLALANNLMMGFYDNNVPSFRLGTW